MTTTTTLRALALRTSGLGLLSFAGTGLLCMRDRHGPPGAPSRLAQWLDPPWYLVAGVSMTVNTIDAVVRGILWNQNSFELTADMSIAELRGLMRAKDEEDGGEEAGVAGVAGVAGAGGAGAGGAGMNKSRGKGKGRTLIFAPNHQTYLDAPLLVPLLWRVGMGLIEDRPDAGNDAGSSDLATHGGAGQRIGQGAGREGGSGIRGKTGFATKGNADGTTDGTTDGTADGVVRTTLRAGTDGLSDSTLPPWPWLWRDSRRWIFSVGSADVLFSKRIMGTMCSSLCGLPVQMRWTPSGEDMKEHAPEDFDLTRTQYIPDLAKANRTHHLLLFPEGRLAQNAIEPRDDLGRWTNRDGRVNEPGGEVLSFFSGIGRLVAHTRAAVVPIGHHGLGTVLASKDASYKFAGVAMHFGKDVRVHVGAPVECDDLIEEWERRHPLLSLEDISAPDTTTSSEKRWLYRAITERVREHVVRCHTICREGVERAQKAAAQKAIP